MRAPSTFMLAALALCVSRALAATPAAAGYATDSTGNPVTSSAGDCWRTSQWTPGMAGACRAGANLSAGTAAGPSPGNRAARATPGSSDQGAAGIGGGRRDSEMASSAGLTDSSGMPVRNGFGQCWGTGFSGPDPSCAAVAGTAGTAAATSRMDRSPTGSRPTAALAAPATTAAPTGFAPIRAPGNPAYLTDSSGIVVRSSQGECWRTGSWSPALATVVGCDGVLARAAPVPVPAPSPQPEPLPPAEPQTQMQPDVQASEPLPAPPTAPTPPAAVAPTPAPTSPSPSAAAPSTEAPSTAAPSTRPAPAAPPSPPAAAPADIAPPQTTQPPRADAAPAERAEQQPKAEKVTLDTDTYFDFDKSTLKPEGRRKLDELASRIASMQLEVVVATGHTDWTGTDTYNQKLSERRARAVKNYLTEKGLPADRIFTDGKGEKQPVASNKTREGRAANRRVEVELVGTRR